MRRGFAADNGIGMLDPADNLFRLVRAFDAASTDAEPPTVMGAAMLFAASCALAGDLTRETFLTRCAQIYDIQFNQFAALTDDGEFSQ